MSTFAFFKFLSHLICAAMSASAEASNCGSLRSYSFTTESLIISMDLFGKSGRSWAFNMTVRPAFGGVLMNWTDKAKTGWGILLALLNRHLLSM